MGVGHGLVAGRYVLRELLVRHDLPVHVVWPSPPAPLTTVAWRCSRSTSSAGTWRESTSGGLTFALVVDTPPVMSDGGWKLGVVMDSAATEQQAGALGRVLGGELGGTPAMLGPLIGEMAGIEQAPVEWHQSDGTFTVRFGDLIDVEVKEHLSGGAFRAGSAGQRVPSGEHDPDGGSGDKIEG